MYHSRAEGPLSPSQSAQNHCLFLWLSKAWKYHANPCTGLATEPNQRRRKSAARRSHSSTRNRRELFKRKESGKSSYDVENCDIVGLKQNCMRSRYQESTAKNSIVICLRSKLVIVIYLEMQIFITISHVRKLKATLLLPQ